MGTLITFADLLRMALAVVCAQSDESMVEQHFDLIHKYDSFYIA